MKYEFKGTKGKWSIDEVFQDTFVVAESGRVAEVYSLKEREDAHLIAAAPELLEACKQALATIENIGHPDGETACILRDALSKALNIQ